MSSLLGQESEFGFGELFFSRTNVKGVIQSGNSVFQRVSKYEWDEIIKKPHSVIRHPAMPRAVFHLLWETILDGKPVGAYVVNRAKDGSYYWVFALVSPIEGGFLSVRLKPSSPIFETVKKAYATLLEVENSRKISPKDSQAILLQTIESLSFRSYRHFMTEALMQELESRQERLGLEPIPVVQQLRKVLRLGAELQKKCQEIFAAYRASAFVPLNLEVQAAKIGQEAAPLGVISTHYDGLAKQIRGETQKFMDAGNLVQEKVEECQFDVCNSILQKEMVCFFRTDDKPSPVQKEVEMEYLERAGTSGMETANARLLQLEAEFSRFAGVCEEVRKLATALEIVSISGRIEVAKIRQVSGELQGFLDDLAKFKAAIKSSLKEVDDLGRDLMAQTRAMRAELEIPGE